MGDLMGWATETAKSRRFTIGESGSSFRLQFVALQCDEEEDAYVAVVAEMADPYKGLGRDNFDFDEQGPGSWLVNIDYKPGKLANAPDSDPAVGEDPGPKGEGQGGGNPAGDKDPSKPIGRQVSWSTAGGTKHIMTDLETIQSWHEDNDGGIGGFGVNGAGACRAIGWTRTGIAGTDVIAGNPEITLAIQCPEISLGYFCRLNAMTGTVNDAEWNGFDAGEMLFLGADGQWVDGDQVSGGEGEQPGHWAITFRFKYSPNKKDPDTVIGSISLGDVKGWDLIDVTYMEAAVTVLPDDHPDFDAADIVMIQVPEYVYVRKVYPYENFDLLGLDDAIFAIEA